VVVAARRSLKGRPTGRCQVCKHPELARINYLLVATAGEIQGGRRAVSAKFGLDDSALYRHRRNHIPPSFVEAVRFGPLGSEERLRKLAAENGSSVLERFNGLYNGHLQRWLSAFEGGHDSAMCRHGDVMTNMLNRIALLTRELVPAAHVENHLHLSADFAALQNRAVRVLRKHPEALADWLSEFAPASSPKLIEAAADD
jgi:hypothetical protein